MGAVHVKRLINQLKHHANRTICQHSGIDEIPRNEELPVGPDAAAAAAARRTGGISVDTLAGIGVVVVDHVPVVDDQLRGAFGPDVDRAAGERFAFPGDEGFAVRPVRDAIVLPGEIVEALAHETAVSAEVFFRVLALRAGGHGKGFCLAGREVGLEDEDVGLVVIVVIGVYGLGQELFAGAVAHVKLRQIFFGERRELFCVSSIVSFCRAMFRRFTAVTVNSVCDQGAQRYCRQEENNKQTDLHGGAPLI